MNKMLLACATAVSLAACNASGNEHAHAQQAYHPPSNAPQKRELVRHPIPQNLDFSQVSGSLKSFEINGQTVQYRALLKTLCMRSIPATRAINT